MGGTKNPRAHIKRHSFLRDAAQEKACPVVEMPRRAGSRIYTQVRRLETTEHQTPHDKHTQITKRPQRGISPGYQVAKAKSQNGSQSHSICSQTFQGQGRLAGSETPDAVTCTWWASINVN